MYNRCGKENTKEGEEVKETYILLSGTLAVVTSAARGTTISPVAVDAVVDIKCSLYPKIHPFVRL